MAQPQENDYRRNQRRVAVIRYLGELYNYSMIDSTIIFDTLYLLLTFGHERGKPDPERGSPIDAVDDYFRIRLVSACVLARRARTRPCTDASAPMRPPDVCTVPWTASDLHTTGHVRELLQ